ncbi:MAG: nucleoside-diphosphate kinase [candidate division WOR-3 bacterium]
MERTLLMIKPDAVEKKLIGRIIWLLEENGFKILQIRSKNFSRDEAERFYEVHKGKPFFNSLVDYITSGMVVGIMLERENAVEKLRELVGATDPKNARLGTIRAMFGENIERNAVHASDTPQNAERELKFFFEI